MDTTKITLAGKEYPLAMNLGLIMKIEAKGETVGSMLDKISELSVTDSLWMLSAMMTAAKEMDTYRRGKGLEPVCEEDFTPLTVEDLQNTFTYVNYMEDIFIKLQEAMTALLKPNVEAKPSKKGKGATQAE